MAAKQKSKRVRQSAAAKPVKNAVRRCRIFEPFRTLGYVAGEVPHSIQMRGQDAFLTTSIGKSFHVYDIETLNLLFVGPHLYEDITSVISSGEHTYVAAGGKLVVCHRGKKITEIENTGRSPLRSLMIFGEHIVGYDDEGRISIWDSKTQDLFAQIALPKSDFHISCMLHPSTYLNKLLLGSVSGRLEIWNIKTRKRIYEIKSFGSPVTALAQTPVVDVVAIGLLDGRIIIHNIRQDETLMTFQQEGKVTAVSFRTDDQPIMASANADGDISLWDLDERRLIHVMRGAHDGLIPSIDFLRKQPILLSSGADNAVKEWIFDSLDGVPRLLKQRSGHYGPPQSIRYYGEDGRVILSAGRDQALRYFSVTRDSQNVELSQGSLERAAKLKRMNVRDLRLPCITQFSADLARQKDWDNILTCHLNDPRVFTWSIKRKAIGKHAIPLNDGAIAKAVAVSACGNFGFIGTSAGYVDVINMQSGRHRKRLEGHERTVTAVQCDRINHFVYTAGLDKTVKVWDFATSKLIASIQLPSSVSTLLLHRDSDLLAAACDDMVIRVIDAESHKVVRLFAGHENRITDIAFSPDGRWLVSASLDGTIRTWDLPTGYMIDGFRVPSVPISLAFSPTGDFLATSHMDSPGIFLWSNRTQFTGIDIQPIRGEDLAAASLPTSAMGHDEDDSKDSGEAEAREQERLAATETSMYLTPEKLTEDLVTLSSMPKSKWQTLLNLEIIKKRNKPKEPPKAPEKAPFFLPSVRDMSKGFAENDGDDGAEDAELRARFGAGDGPVKSSIHTTSGGGLASIKTALSLKLEKAAQTKDYAPVMNYLQSLNPSGVDYELRSLTVDSNLTDFVAFLEMLDHHLATKRDFELVQVYLNVFLRIHSDIITNNPEKFEKLLRKIQIDYSKEWERLSGLIRYSLCMVDYCRASK